MKTGLKTCGAAALAALIATGAVADGHADNDKIIFVSGPSSDPFFGAIEKGFSLAAEQLGADAEYIAPPDFNEIVQVYTRMVESAISRDPAAIVLGNFFPDSLSPLIEEASEKGIAIVVYNSGRDTWQDLGAVAFIGEEPFQMGYSAGEAAAEAGVTNAMCINHVAANPVLQMRCDGYVAAITEAGGNGETFVLKSEDAQNSQRVRATVAGVLNANPDVNGLLTLGAGVGVDAAEAIADAGKEGEVRVGTIDLSTLALEYVQEGKMDFAVDQQPFLQGYYGVLMAQQWVDFGLAPANAINSGPLLIDATSVDKVLAVGDAFPGYRGAN